MTQHSPLLLKELGLGPVWIRRGLAVSAKEVSVATVTEDDAIHNVQSVMPDSDSVVAPKVATTLVAEHAEQVTAQPSAQPVTGMGWDTLQDVVSTCELCALCHERKNTVFGVGDKNANWMFVGEGPGRNEDIQGEPFVGKAGQLLDNMIKAMGLHRGDNVYIANIIKCRPTDQNGKDRRPSLDEVAACSPYLKQQIELVKPAVIVALGHTAAWALLGIDPSHSVGKLRGQVHHYNHIPVIVTYHPSYLLRQPQDKGQAWKDLCLAMQANPQTVPHV